MKSVLVSGCAGFIGSHLSEFYLKQNYQVFGIDNFSTGTRENLKSLEKNENFHFKEHDVSQSWDSLNIELPNQSLIFHLASPAAVNHYQALSLETMWANSIGLANALSFSTRSKSRLIFSSTSEIYGSPQITPQPESYWGHVNSFGERSCYDESKRFGEALIFSWNKKHSSNHGLVRIFNTYGTRMNLSDGRVVLNFVRQALSGEPITLYGDGEQTRSFCYIDDLITGLVKYADSDLKIPLNLGSENEIKIRELLELVLALTGSTSKVIKLPLPADDPPQRKPDLSLARQLLNYYPKTSLREGIQRIISNLK